MMKFTSMHNAGLRTLVAFLLSLEVISADTTTPEVTITQGTLQGATWTTRNNRSISAFLGIPYAQPPTGDLRFSAPVAADSWDGTLDATSAGSDCLQFSSGTLVGDEDCLYLNVYTPQLPDSDNSTLLPVLVHIYGGSFATGTGGPSLYGPQFLLDKDMLLVVMNYRLGVMGFFSTGDDVASGNWGLKDSLLALQWVQENIAYFGGDPDQVTLSGQSAGAAAAQLLSLTDATTDLYQRYITESGAALRDRNQSMEMSASRALQVAELVNCSSTSTSTEIVDCLRDIDSTTIMNTNTLVAWGPTKEPDCDGALLTDTPENLFVSGTARDIPLMAGVNHDEAVSIGVAYNANVAAFEKILDNFEDYVRYNVVGSRLYTNVTAFAAALKDFYFPDLTANTTDLITNFTDLINDASFFYPAWRGLERQLSFAENPIFFYNFDYRGTYSYSGGSKYTTGVAHCDELLYLYPETESMYNASLTSESDLAMIDILVELWSSFVIDGTPITSAFDGTWEPYTSSKTHLRIGNKHELDLAVEDGFYDERMAFWKDLQETLGEYSF